MLSEGKEGTNDESSHCSHDEKESEDDSDDDAQTNSTGDDLSWNEEAGVIPVGDEDTVSKDFVRAKDAGGREVGGDNNNGAIPQSKSQTPYQRAGKCRCQATPLSVSALVKKRKCGKGGIDLLGNLDDKLGSLQAAKASQLLMREREKWQC